MVSRRNFFTITVLLLIMIFMFMFTGVIKQERNPYGVNSYADESLDAAGLKGGYETLRASLFQGELGTDTVIFLGESEDNPVVEVVEAWCIYTKHPIRHYFTLLGLERLEESQLPEIIVVDGETVDWQRETKLLSEFARKGVCVIFARMPSPRELKKNEALRLLAGISEIYSENIRIDGMHLFPGFFIGTEAIYVAEEGEEYRQDLNLTLPWYVAGTGTKTYMMGVVKDTEMDNEYLPSIIWRNSYGLGKVFCINGDYMTNAYGVGFLTACVAEKDSYELYPVINAQNLVLASFGGFADENRQVLEENYDQSQISLFRDIIWPGMIALNEKTKAKISLMAASQMNYEDAIGPEEGRLVYYLRLLKESGGEAGLSTSRFTDMTLSGKLERDRRYWKTEAPDYHVSAIYLEDEEEFEEARENLPNLRTVALKMGNNLPIAYYDDVITYQAATSYGVTHTFQEDIAMKAYETALAYSNVILDMSQVAFPDSEYWETLSITISSNLSTYWKPYADFAQTTLSDSDARMRRFFALDYGEKRQGNCISVHIDGFDKAAYFVLKLNRETVDQVTGGEAKYLNHGFYLLEASEPDVQITVKEKSTFIY